MSALRKLERSVTKAKGITWEEFRTKKYVVKDEEGKVVSDSAPRNTMKKKQSHFDNCKQYFNMFKYLNESREETKEKETVEQ